MRASHVAVAFAALTLLLEEQRPVLVVEALEDLQRQLQQLQAEKVPLDGALHLQQQQQLLTRLELPPLQRLLLDVEQLPAQLRQQVVLHYSPS
ncbi:hypothetical protein WJX74_005130 [Apatococcus lobatus]|uniref:Secreted protein n=1 Tax=Apatococcus lobatus TaxID=904363 RepID=A0AAW1QAT2_9CHLO